MAPSRRPGEGQPDAWWRAHREADAQARAREDRRRLIEGLAEGLGRMRSMRRAKRIQGDVSWSRLSEQLFRVDKWSLCRG